jgi:hypothetical protein
MSYGELIIQLLNNVHGERRGLDIPSDPIFRPRLFPNRHARRVCSVLVRPYLVADKASTRNLFRLSDNVFSVHNTTP